MSVNITGKFKASAFLQVVLLALIAILAPVGASVGADTGDVRPLRLCADPTNLPYSSDDASKPGFYLEVGQAIGKALGRPVTYNWYKTYFGKRSVRVTLLGKQCDAMIGLPLSDDFMGPAVIFSRKISAQTYALVTAKEQIVSSIDDLRGRRVAVQYQTTPQDLLAPRDDIEKVTVLSPDEGMKALDLGTADVAFVWGPVAGWLNKTQYQNRYKLYTVEGRGLSWDAAIGFVKTSKELRDQVDAVLPSLEQTIGDLAAKYGLPGDTSTKLHVSGNSPNLLAPQQPHWRFFLLHILLRPMLDRRNRRGIQETPPAPRRVRKSSIPRAPIATGPTRCRASGGSTSGGCSFATAKMRARRSGPQSTRGAFRKACRPGKRFSPTRTSITFMPI
jgi:polar amino acid transport system substrate-binding protein